MYKLTVTFGEKDEVKALGAKWNRELKHWQIPRIESWRKFKKWLTENQIHAIESYQKAQKAKKVVKLQNSAKLAEMLNPFPNDSLD